MITDSEKKDDVFIKLVLLQLLKQIINGFWNGAQYVYSSEIN